MKRGTPRNKKTKRLAKALGIPTWAAVGILEMLWHFTAEQSPAGDVGAWTDEEIAEELGWTGVVGGVAMPSLVPTLIAEGFLDEDAEHRLIVHGWSEHADDAVNAVLARAGRLFADGTMPKLTRLSKDEREKCAEKLTKATAERGAKRAARSLESGSSHAERATETVAAHDMRTASARDADAGRHPFPALPFPSPAPEEAGESFPPDAFSAETAESTRVAACDADDPPGCGCDPCAGIDPPKDLDALKQRAWRDFPHLRNNGYAAVASAVWVKALRGAPPANTSALDCVPARRIALAGLVTHLRAYLADPAVDHPSLGRFMQVFGDYGPAPEARRNRKQAKGMTAVGEFLAEARAEEAAAAEHLAAAGGGS